MKHLNTHEDLVKVYDAFDQSTAEAVCATLQAAGIRAILSSGWAGPATAAMPNLGVANARGVLVAASDAPAARALLDAQQPSEEELAAEEEADPTTLEEAEARLK